MEKDPLTGKCAVCQGRKVIRLDSGALSRCPCYWEILSERVPPMLRHGEPMLRDGWQTIEVWPLASRTIIGGDADYHVFRSQVWRSILHYADQPVVHSLFRCEAMEAGRITEIHFGRDTEEYHGYRELVKPPLLVLVCGRRDLPTTFTIDLTRIVLGLREDHGLPSWVYAPHTRLLGRSMAEVVRDGAIPPKAAAPVTALEPTRRSRREDEAPIKRSGPYRERD